MNLLTVGSSLYLAVQVADALFHVGDPHYAQGDGEVALTAMEASLRGTFRLTVLTGDDAAAATGLLTQPYIETDEAWVPIGLDADLERGDEEGGSQRHHVPRTHAGHGAPHRPRLPQRRCGLRGVTGRRRGEGRALRDPQAGLPDVVMRLVAESAWR